MPAREKTDVDVIIRDILQYEREEENPPEVEEELGWSPFLAREFLSAEDLRTSDYHATYDDEWWSGLASKELVGALDINIVSYSFSGVKGLVQKLKLEGRFLKDFATEETLEQFGMIADRLCEQALTGGDDELKNLLRKQESFKRIVRGTRISLTRERFPDEKGFDLILELERPVD